MIEDMLIKISKQSELWWDRYRRMAYIMLDRERPALRYPTHADAPPAALLFNRICSCCLFFLGGWGRVVGVAPLTQGDICVSMCCR